MNKSDLKYEIDKASLLGSTYRTVQAIFVVPTVLIAGTLIDRGPDETSLTQDLVLASCAIISFAAGGRAKVNESLEGNLRAIRASTEL